MFLSKFLLNRQKIINPPEIYDAVASHFPKGNRDFIYRLEWYKIGISIPFKVISQMAPTMRLAPECQLIDTIDLPALPSTVNKLKFSIFAVPNYADYTNADEDEERAIRWLNDSLKGSATISDYKIGPNNCLCYRLENEEIRQQTITISGLLKIHNLNKLEHVRQNPLGKYANLGCGYLDLWL